MSDLYAQNLSEHVSVMTALAELQPELEAAGRLCAQTLHQGGKILLCGNGGSAADAQHIAAELVGRFVSDRRALPAIALTTDTSALTAIANDYGYDAVFRRQVQGLGSPGDVLVAISTSGHSTNILEAADAAHHLEMKVIGLSGKTGGQLINRVDHALHVASNTTARIQEAHIFLGHMLCALIESHLAID